MISAVSPNSSSAPRSRWIIASAVTASAALCTSSGGSLFIAALCVAMVVSLFTTFRIRSHSWIAWLLRFALFLAAIVAAVASPNNGVDWLINAHAITGIGMMCTAELALEIWLQDPLGRGFAPMVFSGIVTLVACNTFDVRWVAFLVPVYFLFLACWFYPAGAGSLKSMSNRRRRHVVVISAIAMIGSIVLGAAVSLAAWQYRSGLSRWAMGLLMENMPPSREGEGAPKLESSLDLQLSPVRILTIQGALPDSHLSCLTFDTYHDGFWGPPVDSRTFIPVVSRPVVNGLVFTRLGGHGRMLPHPAGVTAIGLFDDNPTRWCPPLGGPLRTEFVDSDYRYSILASGDASLHGPLPEPLEPTERTRCLAIPDEIDPRVLVLAHQIISSRSSAQSRIDAVSRYLMAHHGYSLNFQLPEGEPLSAFLLSSKAAHCQYFASAAVVLLRCLRVPSRYVSGYYAHESAGPDRIVVRMRDAHAWCESWIDGVGWVTVDATPGGGRPDSFNPPVPAWRRWSEWAQDQSQVIGYRIAHSSPGERAGILAALALLFFSPRLLRLRGKKTRAYCQSTYQQIGRDLRPVAQRFERLLRQQGCPCPTGQTWGEHLSFLDMKGLFDNTLDEKEQARAFVEIYNRARFGAPPTSGELQDIETRLTRLENELRFARRQVNQQKPNT